MSEAALEIRGLSKSFDKRVVDDLDLRVAPGELYALLGPNGAGKTTTLRMAVGLTRPEAGAVRIFGVDALADPLAAKQLTGWLPDEPMLYDKLTPAEYLGFVAGLWRIPPAEAAPEAERLLKWLELWNERDTPCEGFSRGMKQKVALAGALIHRPRLLILDEPLTGLDATMARAVKDALRAQVDAGAGVIVTTHILEVAERLADRIGIIAHGKLLAEGTLAELRAQAGSDDLTLEDAFIRLTSVPGDSMTWLMRRLTPGGFLFLMLNEVRLATRAARQRRGGNLIWGLLITVYTASGFWLASGLVDFPLPPGPFAFTLVFAICVLAMSFMTTQAMLRSQDTLYQAGDLDLLLTAPLPARRVLLAKLCGIVANILMVFAAFTLPIALPVALLGHPGLFGIPLLLLALALVSACLGLAITLLIVRLASPRTARTIAQIVGAFLAAGVFLASQLLSQGPGRRSAGEAVLGWLVRHDYGSQGLASLPGRAALGELPAMVAVLGLAMLVFAGAGALLGRAFLTSYQNAPTRLTRHKGRAKGGIARHFRQGLFATMFAKEARLLRRDPQLAFTIVLRLIYLLPVALPAFTHGRGPPLLPALAFFGVLLAGQLAGSLAWLTVSAEDSPDLITVAPVEKAMAERAKLAAALAIVAPFALVLPLAIALESPRAALITLAMTAASALAAGMVELKFQRPAPRRSFGRRREGSFLVGVLTFLMTGLLGLGAGYLVWLTG